MILPDYPIRDAGLERLPRAELAALQAERLRTMVAYIHERSPFWRAKLDGAGVSADDITSVEDVRRLPFCTRAELQRDQADAPPFGTYTCSPPTAWTRFFTTSGSTGTPLRRVLSARDWAQILDRFARSPQLGPEDVVLLTAPTDGLVGPTASVESAVHLGALVIQAGLWRTQQRVEAIAELEPTVIVGSASYLLRLAEAAEAQGVRPAEGRVKAVISVGEPGAAIPATRRRLEEAYGGAMVADGYGLTELFPMGGNCPHTTALHLPEDLMIVECLDPDTDEPVAPGELGELVYTNLVGDTQPLLRYRTRDLGRLSDGSTCGCGRTFLRIEHSIEGRRDDMIWYRGTNIFPAAVENALRQVSGLSPEYQIVVADGDDGLPQLTVRAEARAEEAAGDREQLAAEVSGRLKDAIKVSPLVELVEEGTLFGDDAPGKVKRLVDLRGVGARGTA